VPWTPEPPRCLACKKSWIPQPLGRESGGIWHMCESCRRSETSRRRTARAAYAKRGALVESSRRLLDLDERRAGQPLDPHENPRETRRNMDGGLRRLMRLRDSDDEGDQRKLIAGLARAGASVSGDEMTRFIAQTACEWPWMANQLQTLAEGVSQGVAHRLTQLHRRLTPEITGVGGVGQCPYASCSMFFGGSSHVAPEDRDWPALDIAIGTTSIEVHEVLPQHARVVYVGQEWDDATCSHEFYESPDDDDSLVQCNAPADQWLVDGVSFDFCDRHARDAVGITGEASGRIEARVQIIRNSVVESVSKDLAHVYPWTMARRPRGRSSWTFDLREDPNHREILVPIILETRLSAELLGRIAEL
jgi:hypothetical protein